MLEVLSMRALQQTLNTAHNFKLIQGFEGQVATMGHTVHTVCKWNVLTLSLSILAAPLKTYMITWVRLSEPNPSTTFPNEIRKRK
jgi:hypothetical protein